MGAVSFEVSLATPFFFNQIVFVHEDQKIPLNNRGSFAQKQILTAANPNHPSMWVFQSENSFMFDSGTSKLS